MTNILYIIYYISYAIYYILYVIYIINCTEKCDQNDYELDLATLRHASCLACTQGSTLFYELYKAVHQVGFHLEDDVVNWIFFRNKIHPSYSLNIFQPQ